MLLAVHYKEGCVKLTRDLLTLVLFELQGHRNLGGKTNWLTAIPISLLRVARQMSQESFRERGEATGLRSQVIRFSASSKNQLWGAIEHEEIAVGFLEVPGTEARVA